MCLSVRDADAYKAVVVIDDCDFEPTSTMIPCYLLFPRSPSLWVIRQRTPCLLALELGTMVGYDSGFTSSGALLLAAISSVLRTRSMRTA